MFTRRADALPLAGGGFIFIPCPENSLRDRPARKECQGGKSQKRRQALASDANPRKLNQRKFKVATRRQASSPALVPRWLKHITTMRCIESSCLILRQTEQLPAAHRIHISAIRRFHLVTMSVTFNRWQCTTPASISSGMIAPVKIQVTSFRPLDRLSLIAE
jgi:hypothetical protein